MKNNIMNTGYFASRYAENSENFTGSKSKAVASDSMITKEVSASYNAIKALAAKKGTSKEDVSDKFLQKRTDVLEQYIRSRGEIPQPTPAGIIAQAAILRMNDIAVVSNAADLSEDDALHEMESAESEAIELNTSDKDEVLPPDVQAALNCVINNLLAQMKDKTGASDIKSSISLIKQVMATPLNEQGNTNNAIGDTLFPTGLPTTAPTVTVNPIGTTMNPADTSSSIWDILTGIANAASSVAGAVKSIGGAVTTTTQQVGGAVQAAGGGVVSSGISQYMSKNWMYILLSVVAIVLIIILIARASKSK